jgi:hypothetical protein
MNLKLTLTFFTILFFLSFCFAQKIDLGNYQMEIIEAFNKNSVGTAFSGKNKKYVGLEVLLIPKSKKNNGFLLNSMYLKSSNEEYKLIYKRGATVHLQGNLIKLRKPTKIFIMALVNKSFKIGQLNFNGKDIVEIQVENGNKKAEFKIL